MFSKKPTLQSPAQLLWRINREAVLLLAGPRALLMQIAHPAIAAGVAEHSTWQAQPIRRLLHTLWLTEQVALGSAKTARRAVQKIERKHQRVTGFYKAQNSEKSIRYDATDSALKMWVLATLIDGSIYAYQRWIGVLSEQELQQYYLGWQRIARHFEIASEHFPADYPRFREYLSHMLASDELRIDKTAKALATALFDATRPFENIMRTFVASTLPNRLQQAYHLQGEAGAARKWQKYDRHIRRLVRITPPPFRYNPLAVAAKLK